MNIARYRYGIPICQKIETWNVFYKIAYLHGAGIRFYCGFAWWTGVNRMAQIALTQRNRYAIKCLPTTKNMSGSSFFWSIHAIHEREMSRARISVTTCVMRQVHFAPGRLVEFPPKPWSMAWRSWQLRWIMHSLPTNIHRPASDPIAQSRLTIRTSD